MLYISSARADTSALSRAADKLNTRNRNRNRNRDSNSHYDAYRLGHGMVGTHYARDILRSGLLTNLGQIYRREATVAVVRL